MDYSDFLELNIEHELGKPIHIYGLFEPATGELRYIGKSINPAARLRNHLNDKSKCHRANWIQALQRQGLTPRMEIIETLWGEWPWQEAERFWIRRTLQAGCRLVNNTSGGDGVPDLPPETREKMRQVWLGRKHKPETLIKLSKASKGRVKSEKSKAVMRQKMKGREIKWAGKLAVANRKLSANVEAIKRRLDAGERVCDLAAEYKVHRTTITKINTGVYFEPYRNPNPAVRVKPKRRKQTCSICGVEAEARNLCKKHYSRAWKRGFANTA